MNCRKVMSHNAVPLTHEQCRSRVCVCCGVKLKKNGLMSSSTMKVVKEHSCYPLYDPSILSYPTGLCSTCYRALYKIRSGEQMTSWGGPHPPTWTEFNINSIFGARTCGNIDTQGLTQLCDICKHVKFNPIGSKLPKKILNKPQMLQTRGAEQIPVTSKSVVIHDHCGKCLAEKRP